MASKWPLVDADSSSAVKAAKLYIATTGNKLNYFEVTTGLDAATVVHATSDTTGTSVTAVDDTNIFYAATHGLSATDRVFFEATTIPTGLTAGTVYYVINATVDTFQVSTTSGGSAAAFTSAGDTVKVYPAPTQHNGDILVVKFAKSDTSDRTVTFKGGFNTDDPTVTAATATTTTVLFVYDETSLKFNRIQ